MQVTVQSFVRFNSRPHRHTGPFLVQQFQPFEHVTQLLLTGFSDRVPIRKAQPQLGHVHQSAPVARLLNNITQKIKENGLQSNQMWSFPEQFGRCFGQPMSRRVPVLPGSNNRQRGRRTVERWAQIGRHWWPIWAIPTLSTPLNVSKKGPRRWSTVLWTTTFQVLGADCVSEDGLGIDSGRRKVERNAFHSSTTWSSSPSSSWDPSFPLRCYGV